MYQYFTYSQKLDFIFAVLRLILVSTRSYCTSGVLITPKRVRDFSLTVEGLGTVAVFWVKLPVNFIQQCLPVTIKIFISNMINNRPSGFILFYILRWTFILGLKLNSSYYKTANKQMSGVVVSSCPWAHLIISDYRRSFTIR